MNSTVCRVCFTANVKMHCIADIGLQGLYELIAYTELQLNIKDGSPKTICYMCCSQLQRCYRFSQMAQTAERMLTELANMIEVSQYTDLTNENMMHNLSISPIKFQTTDNEILVSLSVKEEIVEDKKPTPIEVNLCEVTVKVEQSDQNDDVSDASGIKQTDSYSKSLTKKTKRKKKASRNTKTDYSCDLCDKAYATKRSLLIHMGRTHRDTTNKTSYSCNMSDPDGRPFTCNVCRKKFKTYSKVKVHSRIHTGARPFACSHCNKTFNQNSALNTHMRIHSGDKPHACDRCGKTFFQKYNLQTHMRYHTGDRPFSCKECDKTFHSGSTLNSHMTIHSNDKPYSCSLCDKSFSQNQYLHTHMIMHSDNKPHECQLCNKTYRRKKELRVHMVSHSGVKAFVCKLCDRTFIQNSSLKRHMKRTHKVVT